MTRPLRTILCAAAILVLTPFLSGIVDAKPGRGGGGGGGGGHGGGGGGGGGPRIHMGGPQGGPRHAMPQAMPRGPAMMQMRGPAVRHAMPRGPAMRAFHGSRAQIGPRIRTARPAFHRSAAVRRSMHAPLTARALNRAGLDRRVMNRNLNRNLGRNVAPGPALSNRAAARALRSAPVNARGDARSTSAFALRAFSGRSAQLAAGRVFGNPALARQRFDPAFFGRVRFAGAFWPGPFFWPYAYYDEAFWLWPSAYDEAFWAYGYDDILLGIYRPYAFSDYDDFIGAIGQPVRRARGHQPAPRSFAELCGAAAPGLTDWPVDQITAAVEPTQQQRALLDELIQASDKAAEILRAACPRNASVTPISRLDALQQQLAALEQAVRLVRPKLEAFYGALSDDQKERFNALGPTSTPDRRRARSAAAPQAERLARACEGRGIGPADWPLGRIEETVRPDERQRAALNELRAATADAAKMLASACPNEMPLTPTGRLGVMERRIDAMLQAVATLQPALAKFYAVLSDEQKARFNRTLVTGDRRTG